MDSFTFQYPVKQYFGKGCLETALNTEMPKMGNKVMLAYGGGSLKRSGLYDRIRKMLEAAGKTVMDFSGIMPNPTYAKVQEGAKIARENNVDFMLAVGGGSVIDCCKIVSIQAKTDDDIWSMQYGKERRMATDCIPMGAIVTASGTGAEQNNGAVITNEELKLKQPLFGAFNSFAVLDSDLTLTLPMKQVISGAFDTLSHCMETYMGHPAHTNLTDEINEAIMRNVIKNIRALIADPDNDFARGELMWASAMAENSILKLGKIPALHVCLAEHVAEHLRLFHHTEIMVLHYLRIDVTALIEQAVVYLIETGAHHFKVLVKLQVAARASRAFLGTLVPVGRMYLPADCKLGLLTFGCDSRIDGVFPIAFRTRLPRKESQRKK